MASLWRTVVLIGCTAVSGAADRVPAGPLIRCETGTDWGTSWVEVSGLLNSVTGVLWTAPTPIPPMVVYRSNGVPITNYQKDPAGRVRIGLTPHGSYWCQFVYQFSHEFCHTMTRFSPVSGKRRERVREANMWFEEALCETASLYVLRKMPEVWLLDGVPAHAAYARNFSKYAEAVMAQPGGRLPEGQTFTEWFFDRQAVLRRTPETRTFNLVVAKELLPLFEANPQGWEALCYLNHAEDISRKPFQDFLNDWRDKCPEDLRPFVEKVSAVFYR